MNWLVADYIKYYENIVSDLQCKEILGCTENTFVPSTYSSHDNKIKGEERVRMDEFWVKNDSVLWPTLLSCFEKVIKNFNAVLEVLEKEKGNQTIKGDLVKSAFLTSTMGVSYILKLP